METKEMKRIICAKAVICKKSEVKTKLQAINGHLRKINKIPSIIHLEKVYTNFSVLTPVNGQVLILIKDKRPCEFDMEIYEVKLELNNNYFSYHEILEQLLPEGVTVPSSFEIVGDIVHLNLTDEQLEYKKLIGEVIHQKTGKIVITKVGTISNEYRCFEMEILAGEGTLQTIHKEGDLSFHIDYSHVYWCSKLQGERFRLLKHFKSGQTVCDLFCGVGPLALAAAKKGCKVYCNDLNPHAIECLKKGIITNKLDPCSINVYNNTALVFLEEIKNIAVDHFFHNLPEYSLDYLRAINVWDSPFKIHCYFFCKVDEDVVEYIEKRTQFRIKKELVSTIRKVSPSKDMYKLEISRDELKASDLLNESSS